MRHLEYLHLWIPTYDDGLFDAFAPLTLPHLRRLCCHEPGDQNDYILTGYLMRHPALTHLQIIRPFRYLEPGSELLPIPLPSLCEYRGSATYFLRIHVARRQLAHADLWDVPLASLDMRQLGRALARFTRADIPFAFRFLCDGRGLEILEVLAQYIPHVHSVEVGPLFHAPCSIHPEVVNRIADTLAAFNDGKEVLRHSAGADTKAVTLWSERCPSLQTIQLHNLSWVRGGDRRLSLVEEDVLRVV
ncbi:hypothetical protein B0H19DRAFT_1268934 [Mycena capillaripes]|nr:hypothetical protein B0H19DRAFT_1268934 [Mycena capillaripes]